MMWCRLWIVPQKEMFDAILAMVDYQQMTEEVSELWETYTDGEGRDKSGD